MKISKVLFVKTFFFSLIGYSQTVSLLGGVPSGILFREMGHEIQVKDNSGKNREFNVVFTGGSITTIEANDSLSAEGRYMIHANTPNLNPEVIVLDEQSIELSRVTFEVKEIPESEIKFASETGDYSKSVKQLAISNPFPYFEKAQKIVSWKLLVDQIVITEDKGSRLNEMAMHHLSKLPQGTRFDLKVVLLDHDGVPRTKNTTFATN